MLCDWCERGLRVVSVTQQIDFNGTMGKMLAACTPEYRSRSISATILAAAAFTDFESVHVHQHAADRVPFGFQLGSRFGGALGVEVGDHDARAGLRQRLDATPIRSLELRRLRRRRGPRPGNVRDRLRSPCQLTRPAAGQTRDPGRQRVQGPIASRQSGRRSARVCALQLIQLPPSTLSVCATT